MRRTLVWVLCTGTGLAVGLAVGLLIATPVQDCTGLCVKPRWTSVPGVMTVAYPDPAPRRRLDDLALCTTGGFVAGLVVATDLHVRAGWRSSRPVRAGRRGRSLRRLDRN